MSSNPAKVRIKCGVCKSPLSWDDTSPDDTVIVCSNCGQEAGTYGDLKNEAAQEIARRLDDIIRGGS